MVINKMMLYIVSLLISFSLTYFIVKKMLPVLVKKEFGQKILEEGPNWHKSKEGTPTMGGISFVFSITTVLLITISIFFKNETNKSNITFINLICFSVLNALIGLIDDIAKIKKERNKGLSAKNKFIFQSIASIIFLFMMQKFVGIETTVEIPFIRQTLDLGVLFYLISYLLLCGMVNSVNLSDGLDGLATSLVLSVGAYFSVIALFFYENKYFLTLSSAIVGACIAFLIFNHNPAKIFMGDTGSLFFGALIVSASFALNNILLTIMYGFVFICEAISDILQVIYFKATKGKRLFLMAITILMNGLKKQKKEACIT